MPAALDWSQCPAVESVPDKVSGAWVFRDTRLPVATVIENLEDLSVEEVMEQFDVSREQIAAVLEFVVHSLNGFSAGAAARAGRCSFSLTTERLRGYFADDGGSVPCASENPGLKIETWGTRPQFHRS